MITSGVSNIRGAAGGDEERSEMRYLV